MPCRFFSKYYPWKPRNFKTIHTSLISFLSNFSFPNIHILSPVSFFMSAPQSTGNIPLFFQHRITTSIYPPPPLLCISPNLPKHFYCMKPFSFKQFLNLCILSYHLSPSLWILCSCFHHHNPPTISTSQWTCICTSMSISCPCLLIGGSLYN